MSIFDFIKNMDKDELATLLYLVYNLGINDGYDNDKSEIFTEDFMSHDKDELEALFKIMLPQEEIVI